MQTLHHIVAVSLLSGIAGVVSAGSVPVIEIVAPDPVARAVASRARDDAAALVAPPDRFEVTSYRYGGGDTVPAGAVTLDVVEADGPNRAGFVRLRYRLLVDGAPRGEARATVRGLVRGPALVARRVLTRGVPVDGDAVGVADVDLTRLGDRPLRDAGDLGDTVPARTLARDRVLTAGLLEPRPLVRRGDMVDVSVDAGPLMVTTKGRVLRDGAPGETVPAENLRTGAKFLVRVLPDGSLRVVRGAVEER